MDPESAMDYVTIDFEASCLPRHGRSFPIEVGIAGPEGVQSWLIRPGAGWRGWSWSAEALGLHGIHRELLAEDGLPAHRVFAELSRAIAGRRVIADSRIDNYWWQVLSGAAGEETASPIVHVGTVLDELGATTEAVLAAQRLTDQLCPGRHRAADDARWLWTLLIELDRGPLAAPSPRRRLPLTAHDGWTAGLAA